MSPFESEGEATQSLVVPPQTTEPWNCRKRSSHNSNQNVDIVDLPWFSSSTNVSKLNQTLPSTLRLLLYDISARKTYFEEYDSDFYPTMKYWQKLRDHG